MENNVVHLSFIDNAIAVVAMEDKQSKNTFSPALTQGLQQAFDEIGNNNDVKVVVLHGYDNYFCCGGTQEELLQLTEGKITFADLPFYRLLLDCKLPVIAAMQGHAIGAGLVFGCFADILVMAEEAFYNAVFMKYGFTPGFGATYILPKRFGSSVANMMMYGAQNIQGSQLRQCGVSAVFAKREQVITTAINLAKSFCDKPQISLLLLKEQLTAIDKENLPSYIEQELAMHKETFVLPEVKQHIQQLFGQ